MAAPEVKRGPGKQTKKKMQRTLVRSCMCAALEFKGGGGGALEGCGPGGGEEEEERLDLGAAIDLALLTYPPLTASCPLSNSAPTQLMRI